jgi:hypothetical protein
MSLYDKIITMLSNCTMTEKALFTCACAERFHTVIVAIADAATVELSRTALEQAWSSIRSPAPLRQIYDQLTELPEASIDDSNDPRYYAMRALGLIADAVRAANDEPEDVAASTAGGALDLASDLAQVTGEMSLPELEGATQLNTIEALHTSEESPTAEDLRRLGFDAAKAFARAASVVLRRLPTSS